MSPASCSSECDNTSPSPGQLLASSTFVASKQAMDNARFYILAIPRASRIWSFHPIGDTKVSELSLLLNIEMSAGDITPLSTRALDTASRIRV